MADIRVELKKYQDRGARCVEIIRGRGRKQVGVSPDYNVVRSDHGIVFPITHITVMATNGKDYLVDRSNVKLISIDELMEKGKKR